LGDIVLALTFLKGDEINDFGGNELLDVFNKRLGIGATAAVEANRWPL
jgi:hypothetical protein